MNINNYCIRILFVCLSLLLNFTQEALAYDVCLNGIYYNLDGHNAKVTYESSSYNSYSDEVTIPSYFYHDGIKYDVTSIGENAFYKSINLTKINIPSSVKVIEKYAFFCCDKLTEVIIPESIDTLMQSCFRECSRLSSVSIMADSLYIHKNVFKDCTAIKTANFKSLECLFSVNFYEAESNPIYYAKSVSINGEKVTSLVIPEGVKSIPTSVFGGCTCITSVEFNSDLEQIGAGAFSGCVGITSLTIPSNVTTIGANAFSGLTGLTSLVFTNSNGMTVGKNAFYGCSNLQKFQYATIEAACKTSYANSQGHPLYYTKVIYIGDKLLTDLEVPYGVRYIGSYAFSEYDKLKSVHIPSTVTTINAHAFYGCKNLKSVFLPNSVRYIGDYGFASCSGLEYINIPSTLQTFFSSENGCDFYRFSGTTGTIFIGTHPKRTSDWRQNMWFSSSNFSQAIFGDGIGRVCDHIFCYNHLKKVYLPADIYDIAPTAFESGVDTIICKAVTPPNCRLSLYSSVVYVPEEAIDAYKQHEYWGKCRNLYPITEDIIPFKDYNTKQFCLQNWDYNRDGELSTSEAQSVKSLGDQFTKAKLYSFDELKHFTSITEIPDRYFCDCKELCSITLPSKLKRIGNEAFRGCKNLMSVGLPPSLTNIGLGIMWECENLRKVSFPGSIRNLPTGTLYGCVSLDSIFVGNGTKIIMGSFAKGCKKLAYVELPSSLDSIAGNAFSGCESLNKIKCDAVVPPVANTSVFKSVNTQNCQLNIAESSEYSYSTMTPWNLFLINGKIVENPSVSSNITGDANNDYVVDENDVKTIINTILGREKDTYLNDVNRDGVINIKDVVRLYNNIIADSLNADIPASVNKNVTINYDKTLSYTIPDKYKKEIVIINNDDALRIFNDNVEDKITFHLSGKLENKSVVYEGSSDVTISLDGLDIQGGADNTSALDIKCGKKVKLVLKDGKTNNISDKSGQDLKAALYCKGHLEISGNGTLNVTGLSSHAIKTKEYLKMKEGTINVIAAKGDAIHVGQYFNMSGGYIKIDENTLCDGIQVEKTDDIDDEDNGMLTIEGGNIDITIAEQDCKGIKSDSLINVTGGIINILAKGNGSRGIQTSQNMVIDGDAVISITASGRRCSLPECVLDPHKCMGIKVDRCLYVYGGNTTVMNPGKKSRAIKVGSYVYIAGEVNASVVSD